MKAAIREALDQAMQVFEALLGDLSDADLLVRPVAGAKHIAWQTGHLIVSEGGICDALSKGSGYQPPAEMAARHDVPAAGDDDPSHFLKKADYLRLYKEARSATLKLLEQLSDAELAKPMPPGSPDYLKTVFGSFILLATHQLMHAGQFSVIRRKLGKPNVF